MSFEHPWMLIGLVGVAYIGYRQVRATRAGSARVRYSSLALLRSGRSSPRIGAVRMLPLLQVLALALLVVGLARPQVAVGVKRIAGAGIDIVLTLDISGSMGTPDMGGKSRVEAARQVLAEFIAGAGANRLGLVVFARQAFTQAPLTADHQMVTNLLGDVSIGMLDDGTAIGMAIATAANRLRSSEARSKVIILLTDGANNAGEIDPVTAARAASALGIKIYAIGVGSSQAAQLAGRGLSGAGPELDEDTLRQVAGDTGEYFRATDEKALREIYRQIDAMEKSEYLGARQTEYRQLYGRFVWPALALLALQFLLASTALRKAP